MATTELAVVGAGPAGLAAAVAAARLGVQVTLIDELPKPGGQYLKGEARPVAPPVSKAERHGQDLIAELSNLAIDLRTQTLVWGIDGTRLALHGSAGPAWLEAQAVVVAAGARELVVPFSGWTLPGVMTLGAAQLLAKAHRVLPGRRVLLAGSGPLLLAAANELLSLGAEVAAVLEATHPGRWLPYAPAVWGQWDRLGEGWRYWQALRRARAPYRFGRIVIRAEGEAELEAVLVARLDRRGRPLAGTAETIAVDTLCLGFGFVPNIELTQLAGCAHEFDRARGGWVPTVNERLETSRPGLFVAGETAGVGGAAAALLQGRVAGLAAAHRLGQLSLDRLNRELDSLAGPRRRQRNFGAMLNTLFRPPAALDALIPDDTIICRCEDVPAGEIRRAAAGGLTHLDALKTATRLGQGPCQGRTCGPLLARLIAEQTGRPEAAAGCFHVRPPLKPVPLGSLAAARDLPHLTAAGETPLDRPARRTASIAGQRLSADVVIIGGGIVGAACAYYLSQAGVKVHLVERDFPASGTSRACDSLILHWDKPPGPELTLAQLSATLWAGLAETLALKFEYERRGSMMLAENDEALAAGRAKAEVMLGAGVRAELLNGQGLRALEPNLAPDLAGGVLFPDDAQVDARHATLALLAAARRQGAALHTGAEVTAIRRVNGRIGGVTTPNGDITTGRVVCAAGVWSNQVAGLVGVDLPVRPRKGHILVTARTPGLIHHPLLEGGYVSTVQSDSEALQAALVAELTAGGTLLLGSSREFAGFDRQASPAVMQAIARRAVRFLPSLAGTPIIRSYAGLRPWSPDHLPLIGPVETVPGFYLATGHEGAGICLAPITGHLIANWLTNEAELPPAAAAVRPDRFVTN
ncbi:MAG: FAD-dependent oxidoreductase [Chloroflexota bacterium]